MTYRLANAARLPFLLLVVSLGVATLTATSRASAQEAAPPAGPSTPAATLAEPIPPPPPPTAPVTTPPVYGLRSRALGDGQVVIPSRIATRLRILDADLRALSARGGNAVVDGILSILSGGLAITVGVLVANSDDTDLLSTYLFLYGGAGVARGVIDLALTPDPSEPAIQYEHMPMGSVREVKERLRYGERALEDLADGMQLARILDASINIGVGAAVVPFYMIPRDWEIEEPLDYFVLIGSVISVVTGIIGLVTRTEAERRWDAYRDLRDRLRRERREQLDRARDGEDDGDEDPLSARLVPLASRRT